MYKRQVQNVTIVDIDEKSIAKIGQFPWRRDIYSKILNNLNQFNPSAIAFDIVFSEEDKQNPQDLLLKLQKESDQLITANVLNTNKIFIDSISKSKVVLPVLGEPNDNFVENNSKPKLKIITKGENAKNFLYSYKNKIISLEEINNAASGIGAISLIPNIDGIIRNIPLLYNIDNQIWPSLALEAIRIATNQKNLLVQSDKSGISVIKTRKDVFPGDQNGIINIKYNKFDKENYISAIDVINNDFDQKRIENKIILIGSSAQALFDIVKISNGKTVPGVEIHAHIIDNILNKENIKAETIASFGLAGVRFKKNRDYLIKNINYFKKLILSTDGYIALAATFKNESVGVLNIGTGVVAHLMLKNKHSQQLSGWGFPYGDKGGGWWIGLRMVQETLKAIDGYINKQDIVEKETLNIIGKNYIQI